MEDIIIFICSVLLTYIGDVNGEFYCFQDGHDTIPQYCLNGCCGKPTENSTETNLIPCCLTPKPDDNNKPYFSTSVAGAVFTTVFSLVFLGSMCLCFQRILTRARSNRERRCQSRNNTNQIIMSVRDIRASQRRSGNLVIATIGDILSSNYNDFDDIDEEEARVPKPADIDKQLPSYEEAIKFGIKGSPPPYEYNGYKSQTSTAPGGGLHNQAFQCDSRNSSLPSLDNTTQATHNPETAPPTYNLETTSPVPNLETACSDSEFETSAQINNSNNGPDGEPSPPPYQ